MNLLSNALKFTFSGYIKVKIEREDEKASTCLDKQVLELDLKSDEDREQQSLMAIDLEDIHIND